MAEAEQPAERGSMVPAVWAGVLGVAVAVLTVTSRPAGDRLLTILLLVVGLAVGAAAGLLIARARPGAGPGPRTAMERPRPSTTMERLNDGAFLVVLLAVWGVSLVVLGAWSGLLAGLGVGLAVAVLARRG